LQSSTRNFYREVAAMVWELRITLAFG